MQELKRTCVICDKPLQIIVNEDLSYTGGHYFGSIKVNDDEDEYWECDACFNKVDEVAEEKKVCPKCEKSNFIIIVGGCGQRSMMAHLCKEEDCGHRWNG